MRSKLIAAVAAVSLAIAAPASAGDGGHNHGGHGGGGWYHHGNNWVWGAPLLGAVVGAGVLGSVLAAPYSYAQPYTYPYGPYAAPAYPVPRQCPNGYGGWFWC